MVRLTRHQVITGKLSDSARYEADYRSINSLGVDHAMRCFLAHYTQGGPDSPEPIAVPIFTGEESDVVCDEEEIEQIRS